ncbi:MAG: hypothetical protein E6G46_01130 [Actinobacteria bacterium]|nr:MAG: hypothetical protein E6G46_01130 [Actinomycetota bacterium]
MTNVSPVSVRRPLALLAVLATALAFMPARAANPSAAASCDWPRYGRTNSLSFSQPSSCTTLNTANAALMIPKWYLHAPESMSASTTVSDGIIYEGDWGGVFYAIDAVTGKTLWTFKVDDTHQIGFGHRSHPGRRAGESRSVRWRRHALRPGGRAGRAEVARQGRR